MNGPLRLAPFFASLAFIGCNGGAAPNVPATSGAVAPSSATREARAACPQTIGIPTCLALITAAQAPNASCTPSNGDCGYTPSDLQARYDVPSSSKGAGVLVAIVDAFDQPDAASDLATYRSELGLGTTTFTKYNQHGKTHDYPASCTSYSSGGGWWCRGSRHRDGLRDLPQLHDRSHRGRRDDERFRTGRVDGGFAWGAHRQQ